MVYGLRKTDQEPEGCLPSDIDDRRPFRCCYGKFRESTTCILESGIICLAKRLGVIMCLTKPRCCRCRYGDASGDRDVIRSFANDFVRNKWSDNRLPRVRYDPWST